MSHRYQYRTFKVKGEALEETLNLWGEIGWRAVAIDRKPKTVSLFDVVLELKL